ncbi:MFS transporter [Phragmitibacter flavus]|uniref:MFS transporter n=2 Tax=Phragmitibacter flavus TaxID=2576071 RepID=A0A5R8KFZ8_9BACT|nr:MFS transporter [Phragmitibacter flavus]
MAILAAGVGFGIRGGILANWGAEFGFTGGQLGAIGGAGFIGFCFGIIIGGVVVDKIGYGKLVFAAFFFHVLSAFITFGATEGQSQQLAYNLLYWGTFVFALANGTLEAVANPLVSTLFPKNRTHYLNILHASWPLGMVVGGLIGWTLGNPEGMNVSWKIQLGLFLVPTVIYGIFFMGQSFPKSEASAKGLSTGEMLKDVGLLGSAIACYLLVLFFEGPLGLPTGAAFAIGGVLLIVVGVMTKFSIGSFLLFVLFIAHVLVGAVELGTDGWIQNITGNILTPDQGKILFVFTSLLMFILRFCAHFIEKNLKISPIGLLLICSVFAVVGLNMVSGVTTFIGALLALSVYAIGKTFFWPTMLAVVGDRFPRSGAIAMSVMGGCGMMSAGLLGSAGLGYAKDRFAAEALESNNPAIYQQYKAETASSFLFLEPVNGLDGTKLAGALAAEPKTPEQTAVVEASIAGDRKTLKADSFIPAAMAVIYLLLMLYFKMIGGYKPVSIDHKEA